MKPLINWSVLHQLTAPPPPPRGDDRKMPGENIWDRSADMYNRMAGMEKEFTLNQIRCMPLHEDATFLDIGCGPGRLSVPIAKRVREVLSIDTSEKMMEYCRENARMEGVKNLTTRYLDWTDEEAVRKLPKYDIVLASRSVGMQDMIKLNRQANEYCILVCWANDDCIPDVINSLYQGTSGAMVGPGGGIRRSRPDRRLGYNVTWNMAYDLGLDPSICIVEDGFTRDFSSREEAYDFLRLLRPIPEAEMPVFRKNVDSWLTAGERGGVTFLHKTKSYVMYWRAVPELELNKEI